MGGQNKVSGVVLAGGLARRMGHQDKGLVQFNNKSLISYALAAMAPLADQLLISANRNHDRYRQFGYLVIGDGNDRFDGPLAGILAAMRHARYPVLLTMPCDSPLFTGKHLRKVLSALSDDADIAVAFDGQRLHPVFAALRTHLQADLETYMHRGERKLQTWFNQHKTINVDFSDSPEIFANINTPEELSGLAYSNHTKPTTGA